MASLLQNDAFTSKYAQEESLSPYSLKYAGLDPLHKTFMKLFIRDVVSLQQHELEGMDSVAFIFHGHLVLYVDIMGIVVRVDLKERKHSYVVDDATGVITCNLWKTNRKLLLPHDCPTDLPASLVNKQQEIMSLHSLINEGFQLGDLVQVRGRVVLYGGRKELDVLNISKLDNPNCELERVLELPSLYTNLYYKPFKLPAKIAKSTSNSDRVMDLETLKAAIIKHVKDNIATLDAFSIEDIISWPSILLLKGRCGENDNEPSLSLLELALESVSQTHGLVCKRTDVDMVYWYEVIREGCALTKEILRKMQTLSEDRQYNMKKTGFHIAHILEALNNSSQYGCLASKVFERAVECLESTSDVICIDSNKYMLLE